MLAFLINRRTLAVGTLLQCALAAGGCGGGGSSAANTPDASVALELVESGAKAQSLAAPDYAFDASGLSILTDVHNIVQSATGDATLSAGMVRGDGYIVAEAAGLDTYEQLDGAYLDGDPRPVEPTIPAVDFVLVGDDLSTLQKRTLIIANAANGVRSYQAFEVTLHATK